MPQTSNRLIGIDVAYTVALFGCVVYGFSFTIGDWVLRTLTHTKFGIILDCFPALFFFLNGFTITLTMRDRRISNRKLLSYSGKRGAVLLFTGLIFCAIWPMNILVASGLMFMIIPFVAQWNIILVRVIMLLTVVFGIAMLYLDVPTNASYTMPSLEGGEIYNGMGFLLFNGYFSPLPWIVFFFAGRNFRMRGGIDIRVDAERNARGFTQRGRNLAQCIELAVGFDIELENARGKSKPHLLARFADAGEDDAIGRHACGKGGAYFAFAHHIRPHAAIAQRADNGDIAARLHRETEQRIERRQRFAQHGDMARKRGGRIAIKGRAHLGRDAGEGDILGMEFAVTVGEMIH